MKLRSVMQHAFSQVPRADIPRSTFDRSHGYKTTFDAGYLVPIFVDEALPGDTFSARLSVVARMTTPFRPVMDNMSLDFFFFAVPIRLIWDNWQHFNGEQVSGSLDPVGSTDFLVPTMTSPAGGYLESTLSDYFGIPTKVAGLVHSSFWHRAYNEIYNQWFRDQNLQDYVVVDKDDGPDAPTDYVLLRRGKRHDYFTSCLPWPQKGDSVSIPLGTTANVSTSATELLSGAHNPLIVRRATAGAGVGANVVLGTGTGGTANMVGDGTTGSGAISDSIYPSNLYADLTNATAATINQLRQSFQVQKLYERDARGGTRYIEILRAHFGVVSPDARLQRPEYLGGGSVPLVISSSLSSNATSLAAVVGLNGTANLGQYPSQATAVGHGIGFTKSFTEHCVLIGLVSARADLTYQQGLLRQWSRSTRWDFYWPALAHIGEQAVLNKEIFAQGSGNPTADAATFGYQERFAEYRYKPSQVTGLFRSNATGSLDLWHLSQEFSALPVLNTSFIQDDPPVDRVVAVPTEPHFIYDSFMNLKCARPMPVFGVPGLIDHF